MPLITTKSSSDLIYRNERRMLYAHRILKEQSFTQGETNRINLVSGNAGVNSSSAILPMKEGAYFMTPEETAIILGEAQTTLPTPTPAPIVIPNPVASYLPTNGTSSTWTDTAGSLNVTMTGSPTYSSSLGYTFNGSNQYGRIANANGINNFDNTDAYSVEVWFNPSSGQPLLADDQTSIIEKWNSANQSRYPYVIRYQESTTRAFIAAWDGTNFPAVLISGVSTNTWVQVVGVYDFRTGIKLLTGYTNGASGGTASLVGVGSTSNTSDVGIAQRIEPSPAPPSKMLKGSIGLIRFYNTALSAEQVSQLFTNTRSTFGI
jgi:hypothetical protein